MGSAVINSASVLVEYVYSEPGTISGLKHPFSEKSKSVFEWRMAILLLPTKYS